MSKGKEKKVRDFFPGKGTIGHLWESNEWVCLRNSLKKRES